MFVLITISRRPKNNTNPLFFFPFSCSNSSPCIHFVNSHCSFRLLCASLPIYYLFLSFAFISSCSTSCTVAVQPMNSSSHNKKRYTSNTVFLWYRSRCSQKMSEEQTASCSKAWVIAGRSALKKILGSYCFWYSFFEVDVVVEASKDVKPEA
jgi:hypothetical protein